MIHIGHLEASHFRCFLFSKELCVVQDFNQMQRTTWKACRTCETWKMNLQSQELPIPCYTSGAADGWVVYLEWIRARWICRCPQVPCQGNGGTASPSTFLAFSSGFLQVCCGVSAFHEMRNLKTTGLGSVSIWAQWKINHFLNSDSLDQFWGLKQLRKKYKTRSPRNVRT